jgi:hypothetical protein
LRFVTLLSQDFAMIAVVVWMGMHLYQLSPLLPMWLRLIVWPLYWVVQVS